MDWSIGMRSSYTSVIVYSPTSSMGVKNSTEIIASILRSQGQLEVKIINTLLQLFLTKIFNRKSIMILSLNTIWLTIFFRSSIVLVHGYPEEKHYFFLRRIFILLSYKLAFKLSSATIFISRSTKYKFKSYDSKRTFVIHNTDSSIEIDKINFKKKLIYWGRVIPEKGLDEILVLFRQLREIDSEWRIDIWGDGKSEYINSLVSKGGCYLGSFSNFETIKSYYKTLNGFVFISLNNSEPFGITYMEAAKAGCIVVIPSQAGAKEVLDGTGVIEYGDDLIDKLTKLNANPYNIKIKIDDDRCEFINFINSPNPKQ